MKKEWWKEAVVYQIYPKSFMDSDGDGFGDIQGIISKLSYLKELGVDVLWLSPIYESPEADNGYDISDYRAILKRYGTMEDFRQLVKKAHENGLKIMMDLVVNHTSEAHKWFVESQKSMDNPYRDYYIWKSGKDGKEPNNWGACFGGSAWEYDANTDMYYLHLFSKEQPDLNWDNPKLREEIYSMMNWWCEQGIDGFRMDVISFISKSKELADGEINEKGYGSFQPYCVHGPNVHTYLQEINQKVLSHYPIMTVGETSGVTVEEAIRYAGEDGEELNMVFQFEHMDLDGGETFKWNDKKIDLVELKQVLSKWQTKLEGKAWNSLYWCNHDQPRIVSRLGNDSKEYRDLSAKMLATCIHMMQGTPYVYQGEELGMTNVPFRSMKDIRDIESINAYHDFGVNGIIGEEKMFDYIKYKSRDNARTPMQWSNGKNAGFTAGVPWIMINPNYKEINADKQINEKDSVFSYYKKLIQIRHEQEIVVYGSYELLDAKNPYIYAYLRKYNAQTLLVVCNFSEQTISYDESFLHGFMQMGGEVICANYPDRESNKNKEIRAYEAIVLEF